MRAANLALLKDEQAFFEWVLKENFAHVDVGADLAQLQRARQAGLSIGSADLANWEDIPALMSADANRRQEALQRAEQWVQQAADCGVKVFFYLLLPEDPTKPARDNLLLAAETCDALATILQKRDAVLAIEGWPELGALACTPESWRLLAKEAPQSCIGLNYDPSHLQRMGIDPYRFLREFGGRIHHVHGKDTRISAELQYEFGTQLSPVCSNKGFWHSNHWRYTTPGRGETNWSTVGDLLKEAEYKGRISLELEESGVNGDADRERLALLDSGRHLCAT